MRLRRKTIIVFLRCVPLQSFIVMKKLSLNLIYLVLTATVFGQYAYAQNETSTGSVSGQVEDTIPLTSRTKSLKEVQVTTNRPIVQQKADRIIYDMGADPE